MPQRRIAHFEIEGQIGRGGMGVIYRARDSHLGRTVAIKILPPAVAADPERRSRFLREAQAAANLNHPNIATVYQFGPAMVTDPEFAGGKASPAAEPQEVLFLAMELVEGEDLDAKLEGGLIAAADAWSWGTQIAKGLAAAHKVGVIHRDLKPNNIRITPGGRVKLLDFGLAKLGQEITGVASGGFKTTRGMLMGTPPYMSPEQLQDSDVDARSDLFSLGVVLYQMLAGKPPWDAANLIQYVKALGSGDPEPLDHIVDEVTTEEASVVARLLAQKPSRRYPTAGEVVDELHALRHTEVRTRTPALLTAFARRRRRKRILGFAALALAVALLAVLIFLPPWDSKSGPQVSLDLLANNSGTEGLDILIAGIDTSLRQALTDSAGFQLLPSGATINTADYQISGSISQVDSPADNQGRYRLILELIDTYLEAPIWQLPIEGSLSEIIQERLVISSRPIEQALAVWQPIHSKIERAGGVMGWLQDSSIPEVARARLGDIRAPDDVVAATALFRLAIEIDETNSQAWAGLSEALLQADQNSLSSSLLNEAEAAARKAVELDSSKAESWVAMGRVNRARSEHQEGIEQLRRALELDPESDTTLYELALSLDQSGEDAIALESLEKAIDLKPSYWAYYNQKGSILFYSNPSEARRAFTRASKLAPQTTWPAQNLATLEMYLGNTQQAIEIYESFPKPITDSDLASNLGTAYFRAGNFQKAQENYRIAVALDPRKRQSRRNHGDSLVALGRPSEALGEYGKALKLLEDHLSAAPNDRRLKSAYPTYLAKAGECQRSGSAAEALLTELDLGTIDLNADTEAVPHVAQLAQAFALCSFDREALSLLAWIAENSIACASLLNLPEFRGLSQSSEFNRIRAGCGSATE